MEHGTAVLFKKRYEEKIRSLFFMHSMPYLNMINNDIYFSIQKTQDDASFVYVIIISKNNNDLLQNYCHFYIVLFFVVENPMTFYSFLC